MHIIGINKQRMWINIALGLVAFSFILICAIMWGKYGANDDAKYLQENGIEVEAVGVESSIIKHSGESFYSYYCRYEYIGENGITYAVSRRFSYKKDAEAQIGEKITIVIDPNTNYACWLTVPLSEIKLTYKRDFIVAIIFCIPVPIVMYLFLWRGVYRSVIDYKIRNHVGKKNNDFIAGSDYNKKLITEGEVTKTRSWIISYVKVKYKDEKGIIQEKWARSWFTRKEAKYLKQKQFIKIVPYKNTYGILEEMPIEKKSKKYDT